MNKKFVSQSNFVLRKVLNCENCLDILSDFISSVLDIEIQEISLNTYLQKRANYLPKEENFGIADVRITTNTNEELNVGIQFVDGAYIQTKMLMYYAQIHLNQIEYDDKRGYTKTITINILDFNFFASFKYDKRIVIKSNEKDISLEELELYIIELPKFFCKDKKNMSKKEQWISYLKGCGNIKLQNLRNQNRCIKKLDNLLEEYWRQEKME